MVRLTDTQRKNWGLMRAKGRPRIVAEHFAAGTAVGLLVPTLRGFLYRNAPRPYDYWAGPTALFHFGMALGIGALFACVAFLSWMRLERLIAEESQR